MVVSDVIKKPYKNPLIIVFFVPFLIENSAGRSLMMSLEIFIKFSFKFKHKESNEYLIRKKIYSPHYQKVRSLTVGHTQMCFEECFYSELHTCSNLLIRL